MREKLEQYVSQLFDGSHGTGDMRQEILQNTLDRYDDLLREGKTAQEAYDQAVAGIGDIDALLPSGSPGGQKTAAIILSGLLVLVLLAILGSGFTVPDFSKLRSIGMYHVGSRSENTVEETTFSAPSEMSGEFSGISELKIDWTSGSVTVRAADQEDIRYRVSNEDPKHPTFSKRDGSKLTIGFSDRGVDWPGITQGKDLEVFIPRNWTGGELEIDSVSASITLDSLNLEELDVETTSGSVNVQNLHAQEASIETISGGVHLEGAVRSLELDTVSGSVSAKLTEDVRKIKTEAVSGSINLTLPESTGYEVEFDTVSGCLTAPGATQMDSKNHRRYGNGFCRVSGDSVSGSLTINTQ